MSRIGDDFLWISYNVQSLAGTCSCKLGVGVMFSSIKQKFLQRGRRLVVSHVCEEAFISSASEFFFLQRRVLIRWQEKEL